MSGQLWAGRAERHWSDKQRAAHIERQKAERRARLAKLQAAQVKLQEDKLNERVGCEMRISEWTVDADGVLTRTIEAV